MRIRRGSTTVTGSFRKSDTRPCPIAYGIGAPEAVMNRRWLFVVLLSACSSGFNGETLDGDESARLLPREVGVFISESSATFDGAALETILPGTHKRVRTEGFGLDVDMQTRRLVDPDGRERIFTLHATQGLVVERDREHRRLQEWSVFEDGKLPASANPRDLAFAPDGSLWITRYAETSLLILGKNGARATVDLQAFADDDGRPDMSAIAIVGDTAYVALRRLESGFGTTKNDPVLVAIDTRTRTARPFVTLPAKNPGEKFRVRGGALWISCIGGPLMTPPDQNAALVRVDLATATAKKAFDAKAAGGFVTAFELADDATGYAIVASFESRDNPTSVLRFDPSRGVRLDAEPWARTSGYSLWDLGLLPTSGLLLVADRSRDAPGLRILSTRDGARLGHLTTRLEPVEFFFLRSPDA